MGLDDFYGALGEGEQSERKRQQAQAILNLNSSYDVNPDDEAEKIRLQNLTGMPANLMSDTQVKEQAKREAAMQEHDLSDSPATASFLSDENNARLAKDDVHNLTGIEKAVKGLKDFWSDVIAPTPTRGLTAYQQGVGGMYQWLGEATGWDGLANLGKEITEEAKLVDRQVREEHQLDPNSLGGATASALQSMYLQAPFMAGGILMGTVEKATAFTLGSMGTSTAGQTYGERRDQGHGSEASGWSAAWDASVEVATELLPTKKFFEILKPAAKQAFATLAVNVAKLYGEELVGESLATFLQSSNAKFMDSPNDTIQQRMDKIGDYITSGEAFQDWKNTIKSTLIQTSLMAGAGAGANRIQQSRFEKKQQKLIETLVGTEVSKLKARSPEKFEEFAQRAAEESGMSTVYLQADKVIEAGLKGGLTQEEIPAWMEQYGVSQEDLSAAMVSGGNVEIQSGKLLTNYQSDEIMQSLKDDILVDPNGYSKNSEEAGVQAETAAFAHLNDLYQADQEKQIQTDDIELWKKAILENPELKGKVNEQQLELMAGYANLLGRDTNNPLSAIEHLNAMLKPANIKAVKFKDFQAQQEAILNQKSPDLRQGTETYSIRKTQEEGMLVPAVMKNGEVKAAGIGATHYDVHSPVKAEAPEGMTDANGFVTPDGKFLDRKQANEWLKENRPDVYRALDKETLANGLESQAYAYAEGLGGENANAATDFMRSQFGMYQSGSLPGLSEQSSKRVQEIADQLNGVVVAGNGTIAPLFSSRTWTGQEKAQIKELAAEMGIEEEKVDKWMYDIDNAMARVLADPSLDFIAEAADLYSALKPNSDPHYTVSLDFSTLCRKRYELMATIEAIQNLTGRALTKETWVEVRQMLDDRGYDVSCGACYVDSKRMEGGKFVNDFIDAHPEEDPRQFLSQAGIDQLKRDKPKLYAEFKKKLGSNNSKTPESRTDYHGEIRWYFLEGRDQDSEETIKSGKAVWTKTKNAKRGKQRVAAMNRKSGLRWQSWSDFEVPHLMDAMQAILDMHMAGLMGHAYTKVPDFVLALGKTGLMVNMSLIAKGTGLAEDGTLIFDSKEGMPFDVAMQLRDAHEMTAGTIAIGISNEHIKALLASPQIDYVIPYHASGLAKDIAKKFNMDAWEDYTATQTEDIADYKLFHKKIGKDVPKLVELFKKGDMAAYRKAAKAAGVVAIDTTEYWDDKKTGKQNADAYLKMAKSLGIAPKFRGKTYSNGKVLEDMTGEEGYWKLLIDRKMYDHSGKNIIQKPVVPNYDEKAIQKIYDQASENPVPNAAVPDVVNEVAKKAGYEGPLFQSADVGGLAFSTPQQNVSSASTSISYPDPEKKSPIIFKAFREGKIKLGARNADIGGGRYDQITTWLKGKGVTNLVWDRFNRTDEHNNAIQQELLSDPADTATVSNVLNVIPDKHNRLVTTATAFQSIKDGGQVFFSTYTAPKAGDVAGRNAHQTGMKTREYVPEIEEIFGKGNVVVQGDIIVATKNTDTSQLYQKKNTAYYGALTVEDGEHVISLFEKADKSTFLHETSHIFLRYMQQMAAQGSQVEVWNKTREWLGIGDDGKITTAQQETFAEYFEVYLKEGKAPSLSLRDAFRSYKKWLVNIYDSIKSKRFGQRDEVKMNDDIRDIFDRLLATEEEIKEAKAQSALVAMLDEQMLNSSGFTEAEIAEYRAIAGQSEDSARERRDKHKLVGRDQRIREWRKQAEEESMEQPVYALIDRLSRDAEGKHGKGIGINRQSIIDQFGDVTLPNLPSLWRTEGLDINQAVADFGAEFGYETVADFVTDLRNMQPRNLWVEKRVGQLEVEHDNQQDTQEAIRTASLRRLLEIESNWLAKQIEQSQAEFAKKEERYNKAWQEAEAKLVAAIEKGEQEEALRKLRQKVEDTKRQYEQARLDTAKADSEAFNAAKKAQSTPRSIMRQWAESVVAGRTVKQFGSLQRMLAESRKHRQQAIALAKKRDWEGAFKSNEQARLTEELIAATYRARKQWQSIQTRWRSISKWANKTKDVKVGTDFKDQINRLLTQYGIAEKEFDPAAKELHLFISDLMANAEEFSAVAFPQWLGTDVLKFDRLSFEKVKELNDMLNFLYGHGRERIEGLKTADGEVITVLANNIILAQDGLKGDKLKKLRSESGKINKIIRGMQKKYRTFVANTGILSFIAHRMDGYSKELGTAGKLVKRVTDGMAAANDLWNDLNTKTEPLMLTLSKDRGKIFTELKLPEVFKTYGYVWTKERVVTACLNMGNQSNMQRLVDGLKLTTEDLRALQKSLTKEEWQAIQKMWDTVDSLWPKISEVHEMLNYFRPKKIQPMGMEVESADGIIQMSGGYWPVAYDKNVNHDIAAWTEKDDLLASSEAILQVPVASSGFTKGRAEVVTRPLDLSLSVLSKHLNETIRYITLAIPVRDADRVFQRPELVKRNEETIGIEMHQMIRPTLKQVVRPDPKDYGWFESARVKTSTFYMAWNFWTAAQNITGLFPAIKQAGGTNYFAGLHFVTTKFRGSPLAAYRAMLEMSPYMRLRSGNVDRDMKKRLRDFDVGGLVIKGKRYQFSDVQDLGFAAIRMVDTLVSLPAWWGRYNAEIAAHGDIKAAVDAADMAVNKALGSGLAIDATGWQRHKFLSLFVPFMSFAATQQEVLSTEREAWKEGKMSTVDFAYGQMMTWIFPAIASTFLQGALMYGLVSALGGGDDDKKKKGAWDYLSDLASYRMMGIPFIRDIVNAVVQGVEGKAAVAGARMPITEALNMLIKFFGQVGGAFNGSEKSQQKALWALFDMASLWSGIPVSRIYDRWSKGTKQIEKKDGWWMNHFVPMENKK